MRWIFGNGYEGGYALGYINYNGGAGRGFHNDYLAHLCDYGIVGLCLFLSVMISPLKSVGFKCKMANASILFLCVNCFTIEPMTLGMVIYFIFWLYAVSLADDYKKEELWNMLEDVSISKISTLADAYRYNRNIMHSSNTPEIRLGIYEKKLIISAIIS